MTMHRLFLTVAMLVGAVRPLSAACTAIPEQPLFLNGVRGSVDRPFLSPDLDEQVTVLVTNVEASRSPVSAPADVLITAIFKPPGDVKPATFYIAGNNDCASLEQRACFVERLFCHPTPHCITGVAVGLSVAATDGSAQLRFRFPVTHAAGPVTLAVTNANQPPPLELQTRDCEALEKAAVRSDLIGCIDTLKPPDLDPPGITPPSCLVALPVSNDYQAVCTKDGGDLPKCSGKVDKIQYTVDCGGNVLVPMNWNKILRANPAGGLAQRQLRASSAVEAVLGQQRRVYIPSAVFLETMSQQGGGFSPNPQFNPQELPDRPNEQAVVGTADKGKSVLSFRRRKQWDHACSAGINQAQACEPATAAVDCPGALCVPSPLAYFACSGGGRNTRPCTRLEDCPNGSCQNVSVSGSICYTPYDVPTTVPCKKDADCGPAGECAGGLFEYRNRLVNGVGTLRRHASSNSPGVCDSGANAGQVCTSALSCNPLLFGSAACVSYRADALTYTP